MENTKFKVGDKAYKSKGYKFPCTIVGVFKTIQGNIRVVGEMDEFGLLHIFNEDQLDRYTNKEDEELFKKSYEIYIKESRNEVDQLVNSGALVNYREFSYDQFLDAGCNELNPWYNMFSKKFDYYVEKAKNG